MQQYEMTVLGLERQRVEAVVETLATMGCEGENVAEVAHDARNMVTALGLYCDLLEEPGVLAAPFAHYGNELRLVAAASRRLVEKLVALDAERIGSALETPDHTDRGTNAVPETGSRHRNAADGKLAASSPLTSSQGKMGRAEETLSDASLTTVSASGSDLQVDCDLKQRGSSKRASNQRVVSPDSERFNSTDVERAVSRTMERFVGGKAAEGTQASVVQGRFDLMLAAPIQDMALELQANQNLLAALAGPAIALSVCIDGAQRPVRLTGEDLTRVMVNLVKNAAEAMPAGGCIRIELCGLASAAGTQEALRLIIEDSGPGISGEARETIFCSGYTTRKKPVEKEGTWPASHRGLGLAITRSIVEAAGGRIQLSSQAPVGARFEIELPVRRMDHQAGLAELRRA